MHPICSTPFSASQMYGSGVSTPDVFLYPDTVFTAGSVPPQPTYVNGDGDGTVNLRSLERATTEWPQALAQEVCKLSVCLSVCLY